MTVFLRSQASRLRIAGVVAAVGLVAGCGSTVPLGTQSTLAGGADGGVGSNGIASSSGTVGPQGQVAGQSAGAGTAGAGSTAQPGTAVATAPTSGNGNVSDGGATNASGPTGVTQSDQIPATGPGWDAHNVYVGMPTENDAQAVIATLGISYNPGNEGEDANSIIAYLNAHGGVLGRKIVPEYHDNSTANIESNPDSVAQDNCTYFGQDHRVAEVINALPAIFIAGCLQQQRVPDIETSSVIYDAAEYDQYGPYLWTSLFPNTDALAPTLIGRLQAEKYFSPWNTALGAPGSGAAKVGILEPDTAVGQDLANRLKADAEAAGENVVSTFLYDDSAQDYGSEMSSAVLEFAAAGVTHVICIPPVSAVLLFFSQTAEAQHYRPRYAMTSYTLPSQATADLPAGQINGAEGIGWFPGDDVNEAQAPAPDGPAQICDSALKASGVDYTSELEFGFDRAFCDALTLFVQAAEAGGGFTESDLAAGMASAGARFQPGATFGSGLSATNHALPGTVRDLAYEPSCKCMEYTSPPEPMAS